MSPIFVQSLNLNALSSGFADVYFSKLSVTLSKLGKGKQFLFRWHPHPLPPKTELTTNDLPEIPVCC